jgi:hypothetical protein
LDRKPKSAESESAFDTKGLSLQNAEEQGGFSVFWKCRNGEGKALKGAGQKKMPIRDPGKVSK